MPRKILSVGLAILLFGLLLLSQPQVGRANPSAGPAFAAREEQSASVPAAKKDCEKDKNGKDKCKGTVKPPKGDVIIPVTGSYSVGGFCTLTVEFTDPAVNLNATLITPLPGELPETVHKTRQGCLLTYYRSGETLFELPPSSGNVTICFAPTPDQQMVVYYYNLYAATPSWAPVAETTILENGIVCAPANASGVYIATFTTG